MNDYQKAKDLGLTTLKRWEDGVDHHPMSERLMSFLSDHDFNDCGDSFCWKLGGDGDNGESLGYEMDPFFEMLDATSDEPDLKARLEKSEAALDWILDRLKSSIGGRPVRDMDEAISYAEEALKPFYIECVGAARDDAVAAEKAKK